MTEKEQTTALIDEYVRLQQIKAAADKELELAYQIKVAKSKLEALGVVTENLDR